MVPSVTQQRAYHHAKLPELLAPAGGMEQLLYALQFGADAVYLACDRFGLRQRASNFSLEELPRAVELAHAYGARVHVTLNAYAHDDDLVALPEYVSAIADARVDAVIVSDLGVLAIVKETAPNLEIHVSTQASVSNSAAARMWYQLGARRVVCAREMSLAEIAQLKREIPADMEVEVFVHGAMCMAISGRCLISDFMADRHANQGHCVQPCRWEYHLTEPSRPGQTFPIEEDSHGTHIMNSKDLNMLDHIDDLIAAGVDSIKIEGRVKKAFYVATVVNAYRQVLDGADPHDWQPELDTISHRPYHTGFFYGPAAQSFEEDIYVQRCDWVAEVREDAHVFDESSACVHVRCRNRFYEGDTLEVLSPHAPVRSFVVTNLSEVFEGYDDAGRVVRTVVPCDTASKAMGLYQFDIPFDLHKYDMLRVRRKDISKKN